MLSHTQSLASTLRRCFRSRARVPGALLRRGSPQRVAAWALLILALPPSSAWRDGEPFGHTVGLECARPVGVYLPGALQGYRR